MTFRDPDTEIGRGPGRFPSTRRSAVLAIRGDDAEERTRAFEVLVGIYWRPAYKHLRLHWSRSNEDAKDLTQGFFASALERGTFASYEPERGTFRTYLRTCLDRYVSNEAKAASRLKRGGGSTSISLDFDAAEAETSLRSDDASSPEERFYREWARSVFSIAVEQLEWECRAEGRELRFRIFELTDVDPPPGGKPSYAEIGEQFGIPVTSVTNQLFAARKRFRAIVVEVLRSATASDAEFRDEARRLLGTEPS